jgi:hypothetical protein
MNDGKGCPDCELLRGQLNALAAKVGELEAKLAAAKKTSSISSKPHSSDIVKPSARQKPEKKKRKQGGQKGHPRTVRPEIPEDELDWLKVENVERYLPRMAQSFSNDFVSARNLSSCRSAASFKIADAGRLILR